MSRTKVQMSSPVASHTCTEIILLSREAHGEPQRGRVAQRVLSGSPKLCGSLWRKNNQQSPYKKIHERKSKISWSSM